MNYETKILTYVLDISLLSTDRSLLKQEFSVKVLDAKNELSGMSSDVKMARKVFGIEQGTLGGINKMHMYKAINHVLAYHILDICQWVKGGGLSQKNVAIPIDIGPHKDLLKKLVSTISWTIVVEISISFAESPKNERLANCSEASQ
jgi:hypothetical protein